VALPQGHSLLWLLGTDSEGRAVDVAVRSTLAADENEAVATGFVTPMCQNRER